MKKADDRALWRTLLDRQARRVLPAGDDDVLAPVLHSNVPIRMDDREVPTMEPAALERLLRRLGIVEILQYLVSLTPGSIWITGTHFFQADIPPHDDFADSLAVIWNVYKRLVEVLLALRRLVDDTHRLGGQEAEPLSRQIPRALLQRQVVPLGLGVRLRERSIRLAAVGHQSKLSRRSQTDATHVRPYTCTGLMPFCSRSPMSFAVGAEPAMKIGRAHV